MPRFSARLSALGYYDTITVVAADIDEAQAKAEAEACEPFSNTPYLAFRAGRGTVEVRQIAEAVPSSRASE